MVQSWCKIRFGVNSIGIFKALLEKTNIGGDSKENGADKKTRTFMPRGTRS